MTRRASRIDELHLDYPFAGSLMLRDLPRAEGTEIGRQRVATMMKRMDITAIHRRPNTSKPASGHKIHPYSLRNLAVTRLDQVWSMDISYIPMARGFVCLAAAIDWFTRRMLSWGVGTWVLIRETWYYSQRRLLESSFNLPRDPPIRGGVR